MKITLAAPLLCFCATACSGGDGGGGVTGLVMSYGAPQPFAQVMVVGEDPVETGLDGKFHSDAPDPYDLVVVDPHLGSIYVYVGLTNRKPFIFVDNESGLVFTLISGTLSGGSSFPAAGPLDHAMNFSATEGFEGSAIGGYVDDQTGDFQSQGGWAADESSTGILTALQWDATENPPTEFTGFGQVDVAVENGITATGVSLALTDVPEGSVTGTVTSIPDGYAVFRHRMSIFSGVDEEDLTLLETFSVSTTSAGFDFVTPADPSIWVSTTVIARDPLTFAQGRVQVFSAPLTAGLSLTIPDPIVFTAPAASATTIDLGAPIAWTPFEHDGVYSVAVSTTDFEFGVGGSVAEVPILTLLTDDVTATLPDLTPLGLDYGTGSRSLRLSASDTRATVDDLVRYERSTFEQSIRHFPDGDSRQLEVTP